ncbi:hypothetical protein GCM10023311_05130 [Flaviramulus aquimarinus]|uniref:THUMP-like domain-containing protein n=1 Tax=Flaviramulus aquimarinus TaxID=1170456 RepID=A0ABP9F0M6_9FLAO
MNISILNTDVQKFINNNLLSNIPTLLLKGTSFYNIETKEVIEQIEAKKRCKIKLPTWFNCENIYYPNKLNIEQTSSEITAKYKSELIKGHSIIDLTGGFGVDCFYFSKRFKTVEHCEINKTLSSIVGHNYNQLDAQNIKTIQTDGIHHVSTLKKTYDWIYIDPSRRHNTKGKVFFLKDCLPDIPKHLDILFEHSKNIMIKTSPLLDLSVGISELKYVKSIHIVAINNEVKELLWILEANFNKPISIETINIKKEANQLFKFYLEYKKQTESKYSLPLTYLYEPNAAVLKAGAFNQISEQLGIYKLHKHSHLYTSNKRIDFPGRVFKINKVISYNRKELKKSSITKANITTRNFPETVQQIRKKLKISDGGDSYLFFTTDIDDNKIIVLTSKIY